MAAHQSGFRTDQSCSWLGSRADSERIRADHVELNKIMSSPIDTAMLITIMPKPASCSFATWGHDGMMVMMVLDLKGHDGMKGHSYDGHDGNWYEGL